MQMSRTNCWRSSVDTFSPRKVALFAAEDQPTGRVFPGERHQGRVSCCSSIVFPAGSLIQICTVFSPCTARS